MIEEKERNLVEVGGTLANVLPRSASMSCLPTSIRESGLAGLADFSRRSAKERDDQMMLTCQGQMGRAPDRLISLMWMYYEPLNREDATRREQNHNSSPGQLIKLTEEHCSCKVP